MTVSSTSVVLNNTKLDVSGSLHLADSYLVFVLGNNSGVNVLDCVTFQNSSISVTLVPNSLPGSKLTLIRSPCINGKFF